MKVIPIKNIQRCYYGAYCYYGVYNNIERLISSKLCININFRVYPVKSSVVQILDDQVRMISENNKFNFC
jgi:hypothetical protein